MISRQGSLCSKIFWSGASLRSARSELAVNSGTPHLLRGGEKFFQRERTRKNGLQVIKAQGVAAAIARYALRITSLVAFMNYTSFITHELVVVFEWVTATATNNLLHRKSKRSSGRKCCMFPVTKLSG